MARLDQFDRRQPADGLADRRDADLIAFRQLLLIGQLGPAGQYALKDLVLQVGDDLVCGASAIQHGRGLAAIKLVEPRHGAGTYVTVATDDMFMAAASALIEVEQVDLLDILEILEMLYAKAATLACRHMQDEELAALAASLTSLDQDHGSETFAASLKAFLGRLADASHNTLIATLCKLLVGLLLEVARDQPGGVLANLAKAAVSLQADRRALVDALKARDEEKARIAAIQYHQHTRSLVGDLLKVGQRESRDTMRRAVRRLRQGGLPPT